jgi:short-subunit dehydrogenase
MQARWHDGAWSDRVVLLTGASSGIGRALALALAERRARLVLAARDEASLETVAAACRERGAEVLVAPTDITEPEACGRLVARAAETFGGLDVLVNNAGGTMIARLDEVTDLSIYDRLTKLNLLSAIHLTWHALPHLKRSGGLVVAMASLQSFLALPTRTGYTATKHALFGFFEALRLELRGTGVDVTIVAPDWVDTQAHLRALGPDGRPFGKSLLDSSRVMTPEACALVTIDAMQRRRPLVITSLRGRAARVARVLVPSLVDWFVLRAMKRGH